MTHFSRRYRPPDGEFRLYRAATLLMAYRVEGSFEVHHERETEQCQDGWLALDATGEPFTIAADDFAATYVAMRGSPSSDATPTPNLPPTTNAERRRQARRNRTLLRELARQVEQISWLEAALPLLYERLQDSPPELLRERVDEVFRHLLRWSQENQWSREVRSGEPAPSQQSSDPALAAAV